MRSKLLKRDIDHLMSKYDLILMNYERTANPRDLIHKVLLVKENNYIPALYIKDPESDDPEGIIIERDNVDQFISDLRDEWIRLRVLEQELNQ